MLNLLFTLDSTLPAGGNLNLDLGSFSATVTTATITKIAKAVDLVTPPKALVTSVFSSKNVAVSVALTKGTVYMLCLTTTST